MVCLASDMTPGPTTAIQTAQQALMVFTAMLTVFTVATARCKLNAYNDATHEGSELRGQIRA
jgi:hypothetical protein